MALARRRRLLGSLVLAALLLVPALASGHHHAGDPTAPCAACVATHHSPLAQAPAVVAPAVRPVVVRIVAVGADLPATPPLGRAAGRAPPSQLPVHGA